MDSMFQTAIEEFPWCSEEQKEGYLAYVKYARQFGLNPTLPIDPQMAFLIQKAHEAAGYWQETFSGQVDALNMQIRLSAMEIKELRSGVEYLKELVLTQGQLIKELSRQREP